MNDCTLSNTTLAIFAPVIAPKKQVRAPMTRPAFRAILFLLAVRCVFPHLVTGF
jgi:hypothetical protein